MENKIKNWISNGQS